MRTIVLASCLLLVPIARAEEPTERTVEGRVVDAEGQGVAGAVLDFFWSANGPLTFPDGNGPAKQSLEERWSRLGHMEPFLSTQSDNDGRFKLKLRGNFYTAMAMNAERTQGGLAQLPAEGTDQLWEIRLRPLAKVSAKVVRADPVQQAESTIFVIEVPDNPTRPLDMNRLVLGSSPDGRLLFSLPPGPYLLETYDDEITEKLRHKFVVPDDIPSIDLGTLTLKPRELNINDHIKQSQASGKLGDYTQHYGEKLPEWHIVDAHGADKNVKLSDYRGKWVLINFWATDCGVCLKRHLPELAKFYEEHAPQRDQFEIVAICVDCNGEVKSLDEVDRELEPIVKHVWGGKPLPFPVLLDPSMTTLQRYGVPGYETLLVDPEGRLVEGGEKELAEKLK